MFITMLHTIEDGIVVNFKSDNETCTFPLSPLPSWTRQVERSSHACVYKESNPLHIIDILKHL